MAGKKKTSASKKMKTGGTAPKKKEPKRPVKKASQKPAKKTVKKAKPAPVKKKVTAGKAPAKKKTAKKPAMKKPSPKKPAPKKVPAGKVAAKRPVAVKAAVAKSKKAKTPPRAKAAKKSAKGKSEGLDLFFYPNTIAVIGASDAEGKPGSVIMQALLEGGYKGQVVPVCPGKKTIFEQKPYATVDKVPGNVDLAIIVSKKEATKAVIGQCLKKKVKALLLAAHDYASGSDKDMNELNAQLAKHKVQLFGPGWTGLLNQDNGLNIFTNPPSLIPPDAKNCFISFSDIGAALIQKAAETGLGIGKYVGAGVKNNVDENAIIEYCAKNKHIDHILLYIDHFADAHRFTEICREVSKAKPIIALKPSVPLDDSSPDGSGVPPGAIRVVDNLVWDKSGVIACDNFSEFFSVALALNKMQVPAGGNVGIVAMGTGPGQVAKDNCLKLGLEVPPLQPKVAASLKKSLHRGGHRDNPVEVPLVDGVKGYGDALLALVKEPTIDIIIAIYTPQEQAEDMAIAKVIAKSWTDMKSKRKVPKLVYPVWMGDSEAAASEALGLMREKGMPVFAYPVEAASAAAGLAGYKWWLEAPRETIATFDADRQKADKIISKALSDKRDYLDDTEGQALLNCYGIPTVTTVVTGSIVAAKKHAAKMGYPLAVKATSPGLINRYEMKAVVLDVDTDREMVNAYQRIEAQLAKKWNKPFRIMLQPMVKPGRDLMLRAVRYPNYGPVLMFGHGGPISETNASIGFKLIPLTGQDALDIIEDSVLRTMLKPTHGREGVDIERLAKILSRFSQMVVAHEGIITAEINPYRAFPGKESIVLDQHFRIAAS